MTSTKERAVQVRDSERRGIGAWPEEFDRLLERAFRSFRPWSRRGFWRIPSFLEGWAPDVDVFRKDNQIIVRADLPGMKPEDIEVSVEQDTLFIRGKREEEREVREEDYYCAERAVGAFSRAVALPEGVKAETVQASYKNGVLEVTIPAPARRESKAIKINIQ